LVRNGVSKSLDHIHRKYRNIEGQYNPIIIIIVIIMSAHLEYTEDKAAWIG